jgi:peroxiredoxin (alkyl hydroperoxide reductase subunit C)
LVAKKTWGSEVQKMIDAMTSCVPQIGSCAPEFEAMSTFGPVKLCDYKGRWLILFSHPGDFAPGWVRQQFSK